MKSEPAAVGASVAAAINAVVLLVLRHELSADVRGAIVVVVTLLAGLYVRSQVTPAGKGERGQVLTDVLLVLILLVLVVALVAGWNLR